MGKDNEQKNISDYILYNNNQVLIMNKPAGVPIHLDASKDFSLHQMAEVYCKHPLNIVHRIDRPTSGIVIFAKTKKAAVSLSRQFKERELEKSYLAVVPMIKRLKREEKLEVKLHHDKKHNKSYIREWNEEGGKEASLTYAKIAESDNYCLLAVTPETGRHHQIRAQLAHIGCAIKGDVKYGARRGNRDRSIHLHAWKIKFRDPINEEIVTVSCMPPESDNLWNFFSSHLGEQE